MDQSITFTVTVGPFIATHDDEYCPICEQTMVPGNRAITLDEGDGPVTVCCVCGFDQIDVLLGRTGPWQG